MAKEQEYERVVETLDDGTEVSRIIMLKGKKKQASKPKEKQDDLKSSS